MSSNAISVVVDADIARASGTSQHPVSSGSRALLENLTKNGHTVAICPKLMGEWNKHRSLFARRWLSSMVAKKKVNFIKPLEVTKDLIENEGLSEVKAPIAEKDAHLVDAALHCDKVIASNDNTARAVFCELAASCGVLREVLWFNAISDRTFIESFLSTSCFVPQSYYIIPE